MKARRVWRASEAIAATLLEDLGFRVLDRHRRVEVAGVEVGEVDILAERGGEVYAVEVKAGPLDVSGVRQAYVNALLLGAKPLVVSRGYADDSARALAERLGVEVVTLPDALPLTPEDIYETVREAVEEALLYIVELLASCPPLQPRDREALAALASSPTIAEAAEKLGATVEDVARAIADLRRRGVLRRARGYQGARREAALVLLCNALRSGGPGGI